MLREFFFQQISATSPPFTPQNSNTLNFSLFNNFLPNNAELRNANQTFNFALQESTDLFTPVKYYDE